MFIIALLFPTAGPHYQAVKTFREYSSRYPKNQHLWDAILSVLITTGGITEIGDSIIAAKNSKYKIWKSWNIKG